MLGQRLRTYVAGQDSVLPASQCLRSLDVGDTKLVAQWSGWSQLKFYLKFVESLALSRHLINVGSHFLGGNEATCRLSSSGLS